MDRVFLDANVLFSAAYHSSSRFSEFWSLPDLELVTSHLAYEEARRNLLYHRPKAISHLNTLMESVSIQSETDCLPYLPEGIDLAEKDIHILAGAIHAVCTHLVTGDNRHFGHLFGCTIKGVTVMMPVEYLDARLNK